MAHLRVLVHLRPYRQHQPHVHAVQTVRQRLRVRIELLVKLHRVPSVFSPVLPVLHQHAHRQPLAAESVRRFQNLLRRVEPFAAVDVSQRPCRHLRARSRHLAVGGDDLVRRTHEHRIVQCFGHRRLECRLVRHPSVPHRRLVVPSQLRRQPVLAGFQPHDGRCRRRQPHVLHLHHRLAVYRQVVSAGHLLSHVQQQGVVPRLADADGTFKHVSFPYLLPSAGRRRHVHLLALARSGLFLKPHTPVTRVIVRQSVVVPQNAVSLARQQHRHRNLRVHLRQPSCQSAHVAVSVLKLSQSVQPLVLWRVEGHRRPAVRQLVPRRAEHHAALPVAYRHRPAVNLCPDLWFLHLVVLHVYPFRQRPFAALGGILNAYRVLRHVFRAAHGFPHTLCAACQCHSECQCNNS